MVIVVQYSLVALSGLALILVLLRGWKKPEPVEKELPPAPPASEEWVQLVEPVDVVPVEWLEKEWPRLPAGGVALSTLDPHGYVTEATSGITVFVTATRPRLAPGTAVRIVRAREERLPSD